MAIRRPICPEAITRRVHYGTQISVRLRAEQPRDGSTGRLALRAGPPTPNLDAEGCSKMHGAGRPLARGVHRARVSKQLACSGPCCCDCQSGSAGDAASTARTSTSRSAGAMQQSGARAATAGCRPQRQSSTALPLSSVPRDSADPGVDDRRHQDPLDPQPTPSRRAPPRRPRNLEAQTMIEPLLVVTGGAGGRVGGR